MLPHILAICVCYRVIDWRNSIVLSVEFFIGYWWCVSGIFFVIEAESHCKLLFLQVYPMGFQVGQGNTGLNGTGFQLCIIIFMLLFGVTLGQMVAALSPNVQVGLLKLMHFSDTIWHCIIRWLSYSILSLVMFSQPFCGVTIPYLTMIGFWMSWLY